jgi:ATP-dependent exoDNAse (exonuclease V) beta subunit
VQIMTIHKSKGLEHHTVIFVGLDDDAWWSLDKQPEESRSSFFVASHALSNVYFHLLRNAGSGEV